MTKKWISVLLFIILLAAALLFLNQKPKPFVLTTTQAMNLKDSYSQTIQPLFDQKCIACHSCYNSPCQLNLTSFEGVKRGAHKEDIYDFATLAPKDPTRLYVDATNEKQWRKKGFFSVLGKAPHNLLEYSITVPPGIESGRQNTFDAEYSRACFDSTKEDQLESFKEMNPAGRMPLGFPSLSSSEIDLILNWLASGAKGPNIEAMEESISNRLKTPIQKWERFLNQKSIKAELVARYLYEHLFLATLYFDSAPQLPLRLVRSQSKIGPIKEIGTSFPFIRPGQEFYYRLRPVTNTIVHKSHIPFQLNDDLLTSIQKNFIDPKWKDEPKNMPNYGKDGSNPFKTFEAIPTKARYQFFLEHSNYFIMTFIKGPVCRGQTALNVINDHFWVLFLDPKQDALINSDQIYQKVSQQTKFPSELTGDLDPLVDFKKAYWDSVTTKFEYYRNNPLSLKSLWNGEKEDPNANITVYRHFDSATVLYGLRGRVPKTVWVFDYHVFESVYYNLSAGYNVFGPLLHQINSRLYMEVSRVASEDLFLSFLPQNQRLPLRKGWNLPTPDKKETFLKSVSDFLTKDVEEKLTENYLFQGGDIVSNVDSPNKDSFLKTLIENVYSKSQSKREGLVIETITPLDELKSLPSQIVKHFPDTIHFMIEDEGHHDIYTLIHNKDHYSVGMMFFEDDRRNPEKDTLDVIHGIASSYVNLFISLDKSQLKSFITDINTTNSKESVNHVLSKFGTLRNNPNFWSTYQSFSNLTFNKETNEYGYLDLNRYINLFSK